MYKKVSTDLNFVEREKEVLDFWKEKGIFEKNLDTNCFIYISCVCCCYYMLIIFFCDWNFPCVSNFACLNFARTFIRGSLNRPRSIYQYSIWLRGFRVKISNFLSFFCLSIPKRDLETKKTTPNIEV